MRRALIGIVPQEILNRRRKAFVARSPVAAFSGQWSNLLKDHDRVLADCLGIIDAHIFSKEVERACRGREVHIVAMSRTIAIESWLRSLFRLGFLKVDLPIAPASSRRIGRKSSFAGASLRRSASWLRKRTPKQKGGDQNEIFEAGNHSG
jgi:hypothetical protein